MTKNIKNIYIFNVKNKKKLVFCEENEINNRSYKFSDTRNMRKNTMKSIEIVYFLSYRYSQKFTESKKNTIKNDENATRILYILHKNNDKKKQNRGP